MKLFKKNKKKNHGPMIYCLMQLKSGVDLVEVWKVEDNEGRATPSGGKLIFLSGSNHRKSRTIFSPNAVIGLDASPKIST
jgi:hypothetical protein